MIQTRNQKKKKKKWSEYKLKVKFSLLKQSSLMVLQVWSSIRDYLDIGI